MISFDEMPYNEADGTFIGRERSCVETWPDCSDGEYNPYCCRFPKSCSCDVSQGQLDRGWRTEDQIVRFAPVPAPSKMLHDEGAGL